MSYFTPQEKVSKGGTICIFKEKIMYLDPLQISRSNILLRPGKGPEGRADCAAGIGGISASHEPPGCLPQTGAGTAKECFDEMTEHLRHSLGGIGPS
jgi:hypothetical protein